MYYDLLPKIKNAIRARKDKMTVPFSNMDFAILTALAEAGYVKSIEKEAIGRKNVITVRLGSQPKITDFKFISTPSRHRYADYRSLRPVRQGYGIAVLSTSRGIMTDKKARKSKIGGEYLFEVW